VTLCRIRHGLRADDRRKEACSELERLLSAAEARSPAKPALLPLHGLASLEVVLSPKFNIAGVPHELELCPGGWAEDEGERTAMTGQKEGVRVRVRVCTGF
jgi:hypothetical protein